MRLLFACLFTLVVDLGITEIWFNVRPMFVTVEPEVHLDCNMVDGTGVDFALLWDHGKPRCVYVPKTFSWHV